jgi:CubicO group peptidase (beta-lactamase class C family)
MREDSMFRVASAGKPVTAAAALALVADGRLTLDHPIYVRRYHDRHSDNAHV